MNVVRRSEIVAVMKAQHEAINMLMARLNREGELERAGLIKQKDMFRLVTSGPIWNALKSGTTMVRNIEAGHRLVAD